MPAPPPASTGTPVVASKAGSLTFQQGGAGGNMASVAAGGGVTYMYAHLSGYAGGPRQVKQGEIVGYVGSTGNASAPHLHFEIRVGGSPTNPYPTLAQSC